MVEVKNYALAHVTVAPVLLPSLHDELEVKSRGVQGGDARIDVLGHWRQLRERPLTECLWGQVFAETACALLTIQLSLASSERRFKALKRILTRERNNLGAVTAEDLFVLRDWLKDGEFTEAKFQELLCEMQAFIVEDKETL